MNLVLCTTPPSGSYLMKFMFILFQVAQLFKLSMYIFLLSFLCFSCQTFSNIRVTSLYHPLLLMCLKFAFLFLMAKMASQHRGGHRTLKTWTWRKCMRQRNWHENLFDRLRWGWSCANEFWNLLGGQDKHTENFVTISYTILPWTFIHHLTIKWWE